MLYLLKNKKYRIALAIYLILLALVSVFFINRHMTESRELDFDLSMFSFKTGDGFDVSRTQEGTILLNDSGDGSRGIFLDTHNVLFPAGDYLVTISYRSGMANKVIIQANGNLLIEEFLPPDQESLTIPFTLSEPSENFKMRFMYLGEGDFELKGIKAVSDKAIYTDNIFYMVLVWLISALSVLIAVLYRRGRLGNGAIAVAAVLIVLSLFSIPYPALFSGGIYFGSDAMGNLDRMEGVKDALLEKQLPVVIYPGYCNGYGTIGGAAYPSFMLYPFALLRILKVSVVATWKFALILINLFMLAAAFTCIYHISRSWKAALTASAVFAFSPFHELMVGIKFWTFGMGFSTAFFFILLMGLYDVLLSDKRKWLYIVIGISGIINSHVLSAVAACFIVFVMCLVHIRSFFAQKRFIPMIKAVAVSVLVNACALYMLIDAMSSDLNIGVLDLGVYADELKGLSDISKDPILISSLLCFAITAFYLIWFIRERDNIYRFTLVLFCIAFLLFLGTTRLLSRSLIENSFIISKITGYIQFPNRLYAVIAPAFAVCVPISVFRIWHRQRYTGNVLIGMLAIVSLIVYLDNTAAFKDTGKIVTNRICGDVIDAPGIRDYIPRGEDYESFSAAYPVYSDYEGAVDMPSYEKHGTRIIGSYLCSKEGQYIDFPLFYYKHYRCVAIDGSDIPIRRGDQGRIEMDLKVTDTPVDFIIYYSVPKLYKLLLMIALITILLILLYIAGFSGYVRRRRPEDGA